MADTANVVDLDSYRTTSTGHQQHMHVSAEAKFDTIGSAGQARPETRMDDLYPADASSDALIQRVRSLLRDAAQHASEARAFLADGDNLGADQQTMLLQGMLPELFCCREVSEGMAAFILGLFHGLNNLKGVPLNLDQSFIISKSMDYLSDRPFLSFSEALDLLAALENEGINIEPPEATELSALLIGQDA